MAQAIIRPNNPALLAHAYELAFGRAPTAAELEQMVRDRDLALSQPAATSFGELTGGTELPDRITIVTPEEAAKFMAEGYKLVTGRYPTPQVLTLLLGQWAGETGNGKAIHNFNFGNTKRTANSQYWQQFPCGENDANGVSVMYYPPNPVCHFAAYPTGAEGAVAFIQTLKRRENWWNGLHSGSVKGFVDGLAKRPYAYFTADPGHYLKLVKDRAAKFAPLGQKYGVGGSDVGFPLFLVGAIGAGLFVRIMRARRARSTRKTRTK
jgi:hypothetical protein